MTGPGTRAVLFAVERGVRGRRRRAVRVRAGFVAPESFTLAAVVRVPGAVVVGGLARSRGAVLGALFVVFVPQYAGDVNQALTGVIYGGTLIAVVYLLPGGAAGLGCGGCGHGGSGRGAREPEEAAAPSDARLGDGGRLTRDRVVLVAGGRACWRRAPAAREDDGGGGGGGGGSADPGITDTSIKLGSSYPFSGPASAYSAIPKALNGVLQEAQRGRRRQRPQGRLHHLRRRLRAAARAGQRQAAGRAGQGLRALQPARHGEQRRHAGLPEPAQGAAAVRRHRRHGLFGSDSGQVPVHDRLAARRTDRGRRSTRSTSSPPSRTPRSPCSTRTTASARTCSAGSPRASRAAASRSSPSRATRRPTRPSPRR